MQGPRHLHSRQDGVPEAVFLGACKTTACQQSSLQGLSNSTIILTSQRSSVWQGYRLPFSFLGVANLFLEAGREKGGRKGGEEGRGGMGGR